MVLLLNFLLYTAALAFPNKSCDNSCEVGKKTHECTDMENISCCSMMGEKTSKKRNYENVEFSSTSCDYIYEVINEDFFIVYNIDNVKIILVKISDIGLKSEFSALKKYFTSVDQFQEISPPIFLTNSSFLI